MRARLEGRPVPEKVGVRSRRYDDMLEEARFFAGLGDTVSTVCEIVGIDSRRLLTAAVSRGDEFLIEFLRKDDYETVL